MQYLRQRVIGASVVAAVWALLGVSGCSRGPTRPDNPIPRITSVDPAAMQVGSVAFTLTVQGTGFVQGSVVRWNGEDRTTSFISATRLSARIGAGDLNLPGSATITVFTPPPGGGASNATSFEIQDRVTSLTVDQAYPSLFAADTTQLTATSVGTTGDTLQNQAVLWSSRSAAVASVDSDGVVTGHAAGLAEIVASADDVSDTVTVAVLEPRIRSNREIAFLEDYQGPQGFMETELGLVQPGNDSSTVISATGEYVVNYAWAPAGDRLVITYTTQNNVGRHASYVANADGSGEAALPEFLNSPDWSPDGSRIAYRNYISSGESDVYTITASGDSVTRLTSAPGDELDPVWSPDGRQIAYRHVQGADSTLRVMAADGTHDRLVASGHVVRASWSPDGKYLVYSTGDGIWMKSPDGSAARSLTAGCVAAGTCTSASRFDGPAWSPDGHRVAFHTIEPSNENVLVIVELRNGQVIQCCSIPSGAWPRWSPDGTELAFEQQNGSGVSKSIEVVNADGTNVHTVATGPTSEAADPQWQP